MIKCIIGSDEQRLQYYKNLDAHPFTGEREVKFKARISEKECLKQFFDGTPNVDQVKGVTPGKVYEIYKVEGYGDGADFFFKNDNGRSKRLANFFFE